MPEQKRFLTKVPSYRQRPGRSQALVTLTDAVTRQRRDYWLGEFGTPASRETYHQTIAAWEANGRRLPEVDFEGNNSAMTFGGPTISEVVHEYWNWAKDYYRPHHAQTLKSVLGLLRKFYGGTPATDFGPKKLRLLRNEMIRGDQTVDPSRPPWSRKYINGQVQRIRHLFKWAAAHELMPVTVFQTLGTLEPLKRGRCNVREGKKVGPVPADLLRQSRRHMNRQVRALVWLQSLTGARAGELLGLRRIDIEMDERTGIWTYRPEVHKNAFREKDRSIYFGPRAQRVLRLFIDGRPADAYLFSPSEAETDRREALRAARSTPLSCGNRPGTNRRASPRRKPGECYTTSSYCRAVQYACDQAFPPLGELQQRESETKAQWDARLEKDGLTAELAAWRRAHRWHPHQLRHNAATNLRRLFGLEAAQVALGHASAQITDAVYAERDRAKVIEMMRKIG